jgi:hypothetical protein
MAETIPDLDQVSSIPQNALFLLSYSGAASQIVSFEDLSKNFNFVQPFSGNDMLFGIQDTPVIRIVNSNRYIAISPTGSFSPLSAFHISGASGINNVFTLQNHTGASGAIRFYDETGSWYLLKDGYNNFSISGVFSTNIKNNSLLISNDGSVLVTDGSLYSYTGVDPDVNIQFSVATGIRFSFDDNTNAGDITLSTSGINFDSDVYIGYNTGANTITGAFFGLSGAVFVDKDDATVRVGNTNRNTDARLTVSNVVVDGSPYKTLLIEDAGVPNLFFRNTGTLSNLTASIMYNQPVSQLHFARNKTAATVDTTDPVIFDLANGRLGLGGIDPTYPLDVTGTSSFLSRYQSYSQSAFSRMQSNYATSSGPVDYVATAYGSGDFNSFIIGYDFDKATVGPSGPASGPTTRVGQFFFQTGNASNVYDASRNIVTISDQGDINNKGLYTSDDNFCYGKFIDIHRASNLTGGAVYLNLDNIDYGFNQSGSAAYHALFPASGRIIGVDFICQLNSGISDGTGYLVFNNFSGMTLNNVGGTTFVSGISTSVNKRFFQVWDAYSNDYYDSPTLSNHCYVSGVISGQGFLNLKARINNASVGNKFNNSVTKLAFNRYDYGSWVAYALRNDGSGGTVFTPLTGAMNITTMAEYFYVSDTDSSAGSYISQ